MKKTMVSLSTGALLLFGSLTTPFGIGESTAMAQQTMNQSIVSIKSTVNVRTGPSTNDSIMGKLYTGAKVNLVEQVNSNWIKVEREGKTGYISAKYAEIIGPGVIATIKKRVNVRTGPSTDYSVLGKLYTGAKVNVVEQANSNWIKVEREGKTGYISARFAELSSASPTSSSSSSTPTSSSSPASPTPNTSKQNTQPSQNTTAEKADKIINLGQKYLGTPYQYGAKTGNTNRFDCSSFIQYIYGKNDVSLPRNSRSQSKVGTTISSFDKLQKGDLIFFKTGNRSDGQIDHVAVYMGDGKIIHSIPSKGVTINSFSGFWKRTAVSAKRVL